MEIRMKKILSLIVFSILGSTLMAQSFEYRGVDVGMRQGNVKKHYLVKREIPPKCKEMPSNNEMIWGGGYANAKVPDACKGTFIQTAGRISAIRMDDEIETYGELEVLSFLKEMQKDKNKVLIDARKEQWYNYRTIPGAVNMPFYYFRDKEHYQDEFSYAVKYLGGTPDGEGGYDFDHPKTLLVFCNGPWCGLSTEFVKAISEEGFPHDHIKWFRGGMQAWLIGGFTSTRPKSKKEVK